MPERPSIRRPDTRRPSNPGLFQLAIAIGLAVAVYIYGFAFDTLSEEQLVWLSAAWVLPIVFGAYGHVAEHLLRTADAGEGISVAQAALVWARALPIIGALLLLPLLFLKHGTAIGIALRGTLFWALLLLAFLVGIFPLL